MVSNIVLRELDAAVQQAANRRNKLQSKVNSLRSVLSDASANLQRAQTEEQNAVDHNDVKIKEHHEVLDYYNSLTDKSGLGAIPIRIEGLAAEQRATHRLLGEARETRMQRYRELEEAKTELAGAEIELAEAAKEWLSASAQAQKAREEQ